MFTADVNIFNKTPQIFQLSMNQIYQMRPQMNNI